MLHEPACARRAAVPRAGRWLLPVSVRHALLFLILSLVDVSFAGLVESRFLTSPMGLGDAAIDHMRLMNHNHVRSSALASVCPAFSGTTEADADIAAFYRWCAGENTLTARVGGIENVELAYVPGTGLALSAARSLKCDAEVFSVPPQMIHPAVLSVAKATMAHRLVCGHALWAAPPVM